MSHIIVHDVSARAQRRIGRRYQVAAIAGEERRALLDPWGLNRAPFDHLLPPWGMPQDLELPEDELAAAAAAAGAPRAPPTARPGAGGAGRAAAFTCEQRAYALLVMFPAGAVGELRGVSSPPLPTPCVIVGATVHSRPDDAATDRYWGLNLVSADTSGLLVTPPGTSLFTASLHQPAGVTIDPNWSPATPIRAGGAEAFRRHETMASQLLGSTITDPGARLLFLVRSTNAIDLGMNLIVTVRTIECDVGVTPRYVAPRITARAAPAQLAAPAAAPAPARIRPSYGPDPSVGLLAPGGARKTTGGRIGAGRERTAWNPFALYGGLSRG